MTELTGWLKKERLAWLNQRGEAGGTAALFRTHVVAMRTDPTVAILRSADWPRLFEEQAAADAADHAWRAPSRAVDGRRSRAAQFV